MKNCPNCGAAIDPYRVKCEYCGTMYFDWATWLQDDKPCFINYRFNNEDKKESIITQAIPHIEAVEMSDDTSYAKNDNGQIFQIKTGVNCYLHVIFTCVSDEK